MIQTSTRPEFRRKLRLLRKMQKRTRDPVQWAELARRIQRVQENRYDEVAR